jgi:hypothetical protein
MMAVMEVGQRRAFEAAEASGRHRDDVSVEERLAATSAYIQEMSLGMPEDPDAVDRSRVCCENGCCSLRITSCGM